ncbi:MAG: dihydrolipoyl dehydrogenase [Sandaracinaceae bacterium]|jgi:dihydrolipoamide dehydrogenase|nr:dihydrolipoyl dehydrogenase [Sandaracinaceae bacterium]
MANKSFDAIVIGGGPGGYVAAIRLGQLKQKVLVVEKEYMGGVCLNWGCIPSKALIAAANLVEKAKHADTMGISFGEVKVDVTKMQAWKGTIVNKLTSGVRSLVKGSGGEIVMGTASFKTANSIEVKTETGAVEVFEAKKGIIVATGATPIAIPGLTTDGKTVITAREAVSLTEVPKTMVVIGGGVIGLELGMVYQKLGTKIIVVELAEQLLPGVDIDIVKVVEKALVKAGGEVLLKAKAAGLTVKGSTATVTVEQDGKKRDIECDKVLVAVGFKPNSANLGLEKVGVKLDQRGHITTNEKLQSNVPSIYAIGDVSGAPYLAHKASKEGEIAAEVIAGHKAIRDWRAMPAAIFTEPEVATVGMSEKQCKDAGRAVKIGKFPFSVSGRAMAVSATDGFVKVIADEKTHEVLGVGIVGPEASDLISEAALAIEMAAFTEDVALTVHPHPTLGESVMEAFKHALGEAIHIANR